MQCCCRLAKTRALGQPGPSPAATSSSSTCSINPPIAKVPQGFATGMFYQQTYRTCHHMSLLAREECPCIFVAKPSAKASKVVRERYGSGGIRIRHMSPTTTLHEMQDTVSPT